MTINSSLKLHLCTLYMLKVLHHKMELLQPLPKLPGSLLVCCDVGEAIEDVFKPSFKDHQIFKNSSLCFLNFWAHVFTNDQIFSQVYGWLSNPASAYISLSTRVEVTIFLLVPPVCPKIFKKDNWLWCHTCKTPPSTVLWVLVWARNEILFVNARSSIFWQFASNWDKKITFYPM